MYYFLSISYNILWLNSNLTLEQSTLNQSGVAKTMSVLLKTNFLGLSQMARGIETILPSTVTLRCWSGLWGATYYEKELKISRRFFYGNEKESYERRFDFYVVTKTHQNLLYKMTGISKRIWLIP